MGSIPGQEAKIHATGCSQKNKNLTIPIYKTISQEDVAYFLLYPCNLVVWSAGTLDDLIFADVQAS